ncbi:MAG: TMEM14 family protein [Verrucomicrobiota bacterium]|jgi:uncharacterized membrane protein (UPF0136 family)|nr:TMEM14 family protein [Verrucomicrobiota bacterium]MDD8051819.1 TMEM14 family protein [Verrucomicrobiota bacterium]MDI9385710.1 TMEM14 family protein [Verrucomicrobiota bacterium]
MEVMMRVVLVVYAILMIVGGILGKVQGGSTISLIAGSVSGILSLGCMALTYRVPTAGAWAGAVLALLVGAMFLKRYIDTQKVMPALVLLVISLLVACLLIVAGLSVRGSSSGGTGVGSDQSSE